MKKQKGSAASLTHWIVSLRSPEQEHNSFKTPGFLTFHNRNKNIIYYEQLSKIPRIPHGINEHVIIISIAKQNLIVKQKVMQGISPTPMPKGLWFGLWCHSGFCDKHKPAGLDFLKGI